MNIKALIDENKIYVQNLRRYFHMYPELSNEEYETTLKIGKELEKLGIPYEINPSSCGLIGIIKGKKNGKKVALRADIDALNVEEKNEVDYKSKNSGKMHACGHDAHTAILLGAAKMLMENKDKLEGDVYLIFQPAEELGLGAKEMIATGTWFEEIDNIFGAHVWSSLPVGKVNVEPGPRMASGDMFKIKVIGKSGHSSAPHETVDAVVVAGEIITALQTLVSRKYNPLEPIVVSIGKVVAGSRFNIIAGDALLEGTIRYYSKEIGSRIEEDFKQIIDGICYSYGAKAEIEYTHVMLPTINEEKSTTLAQKVVADIMGEDALIKMERATGGEDFSYYLDKKPGTFAFIGVGNEEIGANHPHHSEYFNIDDSILSTASAIYMNYAIEYLIS